MDISRKTRPCLDTALDRATFLEYYWLKEELTDFCRKNGLPASGSKAELTERVAVFLDNGGIISSTRTRPHKAGTAGGELTTDSIIEENIVCSEKHRAFFKKQLGESFSFRVAFQKWLKANAGKTYGEALDAYREIAGSKEKTTIDSQFEYNTYIRDFFEDNKGLRLADAIKCWKYKKSMRGHNRYERSDLAALESSGGKDE